nr:AAA family ATPase [Acanthopleuribacter pedis]
MGTWPANQHLFDEDSLWAIQAAWAARRPLLIQGEPGCGKSQLARAVAQAEQWAFIPTVIHHRSECTDLQWHFDAVARLGSAQLLGFQAATAGRPPAPDEARLAPDEARLAPHEARLAPHEASPSSQGGSPAPAGTSAVDAAGAAAGASPVPTGALEQQLNPMRFLAPGPLWWTVNWQSAAAQIARCEAGLQCVQPITSHLNQPKATPAGRVLLIDEIDKAHVDLPNGLLEVLDNGGFSVPYRRAGYVGADDVQPLVIITSNGERVLPQAFLRRCCVYTIQVPEDEGAFKAWLVTRAAAHFAVDPRFFPDVAAEAADFLWIVREAARRDQHPKPGQGEFLDLMRALLGLAATEAEQREKLEKIAPYVVDKTQQVSG